MYKMSLSSEAGIFHNFIVFKWSIPLIKSLNRLKGPSQKEAMHFYAPMRITKIKHTFT